jgi:2-amino-4-hydroxy-6-hydroxymethyldihydropteridine diphosphokinase
MKVALSLGSNKGDRNKNLFLAIKGLLLQQAVVDIICSTFFVNPAVLIEGAPEEWNKEYINCVLVGKTDLLPEKLLSTIKEIEKSLGRNSVERWSPREIDIDIVYYGDLQMKSENLTIPHPYMLERNFVMLLLKEVDPKWEYCGEGRYFGQTIEKIAQDKYGL